MSGGTAVTIVDRLKGLAVGAALLAAVVPAVAQEPVEDSLPSEGWWIVMGAIPDNPAAWDGVPARTEAAAACGITLFGDFSAKFEGFKPGVVVLVHDRPFASRGAAADLLAKARVCEPDAYLKYGRYAGE